MPSGRIQPVIVIPTRNRAGLAIAAVRSVLDERAPVRVLVSDNSTDEAATQEVAAFCQRVGVDYVRPPEPLAMSPHWEWALNAAVRLEGTTHVTYLTDRLVFRPGAVHELVERITRHPDHVITFNEDRVDDLASPVRLYQRRWTGHLYRIPSRRILASAAHSAPITWAPRMLNCSVPVPVLDAVRTRFGSLFDSISPDFCFAFRCLAIVDEVMYWDRSPMIAYALARSNGASTTRGVMTKDRADFMSNLGRAAPNSASPVPGFATVHNAIIHEYCLVRDEVGGNRFPPVDRERYLNEIAHEVARIETPAVRAEMQELLAAEGFTPKQTSSLTLRRLKALTAPLADRRLQPFWKLASRRLQLWPPGENALQFETSDAALEHARKYPRRPDRWPVRLWSLLGPIPRAD